MAAPRVSLNKNQIRSICSRYKKGETLKELAAEFECSASTVRNRLLEEGVVLRPRGKRPAGA